MTSSTQSDRKPARCPSCGEYNECSFGADTPCWCAAAELGRVKPAPDANTCLCRNCLERLLAEGRAAT